MDAAAGKVARRAKKAHGVFYTPAFVVDYLVRHTLGKLFEGKTPAEVSRVRILDPACGDGAFLLGAYQFLVDWHNSACLRSGLNGLSIAGRQAIVLNNLYGVDIDPQAVEKTKANLLSRALGGDRELPETALLDGNIKTGNALIGCDFDPRESVAAFEWTNEFPKIMQAGGFDAVIGNPPYVNIRLLTRSHGREIKDYFRRTYRCADRGYDLYVLFIEKSYHLLRDGGRWGMIVPNKIATLDYARNCRELLANETTIEQIVDLSACRVFESASVYPYAIVWQKTSPSAHHHVTIVRAGDADELAAAVTASVVRQADFDPARGFAIHGTLDVEARVKTAPLAQRARLHSGTTGFDAQRMADALTERAEGRDASALDFIVSGNIDRYRIDLGAVRFMNRIYGRPVLTASHAMLTPNKRQLYANPKIVIAGMTRRLEAALDQAGLALGVSVFAAAELQDDPRYLLGLLNSKLLSYLFRMRFGAKRLAGGFLAINRGQLAQLPIRLIDFANRHDKSQHNKLILLVERMLKGPCDRQLQTIDRKIDRVVYGLYGLTADEIGAIEMVAE